ncbi:unnamed protein product [Rhizophagus irregularis]|uniref:Crinkler effector protein N-terminal domain-containing protein n=1 Tax=Rhizophagus irregularis TaxID=588596 RepID=A0A916E8C5_9GLOM|nr:unnamed protein product [Rhizophagus irregularis]
MLWKAEGLAILRSPGVKPTMCLSGRSPCEKQDIKHVGESMMSSTTSNIHLVCFVRGETGKDIFPVVIDNNSTVENLGVEIRKVRQDLSQKNFNLYVRKFKQPNHGLVNTVNTTEKKQGELMEPPNKFTYYFSVEDIKGLKKNPPYLLFMLSYTSRKCWKKIPRILGSSESENSPPEEHIHVIVKLPLLSLEEALSCIPPPITYSTDCVTSKTTTKAIDIKPDIS